MESFIRKVAKDIKHWYIPLIVGIIFVVLGICCVAIPVASYLALAIVFAVGFLVSGVFETVFAIVNKSDRWGWSLAIGIMSIIIGLLMMVNPGLPIVALPYYVGIMLLIYSVTGISIAVGIKDYFNSGWKTLLVVAILGVILSLIMLFNPTLAGISIVLWTAFTFFTTGFYRIYVAFQLRKIKKAFKRNIDQ